MTKPGGDPWRPGVVSQGPPGLSERRDEPRHERRLQVFEEKIALTPRRMYNEKDQAGWRITTRNYWVGRTPDMLAFLHWIENHADETITNDELLRVKNGNEIMLLIDIIDASQQMWAYLNINLQGDVIEIFRNVEMLNGAEAWRRKVSPILSQSAPKRSRLRYKAWNPKASTQISDFASALEAWETDYRQFIEVGGEHMTAKPGRIF